MTRAIFTIFVAVLSARAESALLGRGYTVLPEPRKVALHADDFRLTPEWRLELGTGVTAADVAVESLRDLRLSQRGTAGVVRLSIQGDSVAIGESLDRDKSILAAQ